MEKTPKQEALEFSKALGVIAGFGGKVMRDKEVGASDLQYVVDIALQFETLKDGFEGISKLKEITKDMEKQDLLEILGALWDAADKYEQERKG